MPEFSRISVLLLISLLALLTYLPALKQPLIEDDYPNILLARTYGPVAGWATMAHDQVNRVRATTFVLTHWIEQIFGLRPITFYAVSILLHILNCGLIYALGRWPIIGFKVSAWSAAFYMFVNYLHRIPSRQTYVASAGLALIVGAAIVALWERTSNSRPWAAAVLAVVLLHNVTYVWLKKHNEFLKRAQPTEELIAFARNAKGPIHVRCFPRPPIIGDAQLPWPLGCRWAP